MIGFSPTLRDILIMPAHMSQRKDIFQNRLFASSPFETIFNNTANPPVGAMIIIVLNVGPELYERRKIHTNIKAIRPRFVIQLFLARSIHVMNSTRQLLPLINVYCREVL
jgi:hypothetical protein